MIATAELKIPDASRGMGNGKTSEMVESRAHNTVQRLLIVRLSAMGDVIHTLPAARILRDAFPNTMIGWLIEERWAELLCAAGAPRRGSLSAHRPIVDWVHTVDLKGWRKSLFSISTVEKIATVWNDLRDTQYDWAIDLQGAIRSAVLAKWSGAKAVWGAVVTREAPASILYSRRVITRGRHVVEQNVSLAAQVAGVKVTMPKPELPLDPASEEKVERSLARQGISSFAILNPGAGWGAKRWPPERYGQVASGLGANGVRSIVNFGPGEHDLAQRVETASAGAAFAMQLSISGLIALTRRAKLFVGGDTGPMHLAAALNVPIVAIFGPTDPARNGPYGTRSVVLRSPESATTHKRRAQTDQGMMEISAEDVFQATLQLLREAGS